MSRLQPYLGRSAPFNSYTNVQDHGRYWNVMWESINGSRWWMCPLCKVSLHCVLCMRLCPAYGLHYSGGFNAGNLIWDLKSCPLFRGVRFHCTLTHTHTHMYYIPLGCVAQCNNLSVIWDNRNLKFSSTVHSTGLFVSMETYITYSNTPNQPHFPPPHLNSSWTGSYLTLRIIQRKLCTTTH